MSSQPYGHNRDNRSNRWQDWANLALATWFFFSPWILQFASNLSTAERTAGGAAAQGFSQGLSNASWNAWVLSVIVFLVAISAISRVELWQEWLNLLLGAWIFVAPWVLGFATGSQPAAGAAAAWDHWIVGALIFLVSATSLLRRPPMQAASSEPFRR
jgi:SPW repeat